MFMKPVGNIPNELSWIFILISNYVIFWAKIFILYKKYNNLRNKPRRENMLKLGWEISNMNKVDKAILYNKNRYFSRVYR